ncbi:hypothetical protein L1887_31612 [Cichorium endivia]|nr:hypothetical protein L1887_31612 [Cichorium endivia]
MWLKNYKIRLNKTMTLVQQYAIKLSRMLSHGLQVRLLKKMSLKVLMKMMMKRMRRKKITNPKRSLMDTRKVELLAVNRASNLPSASNSSRKMELLAVMELFFMMFLGY